MLIYTKTKLINFDQVQSVEAKEDGLYFDFHLNMNTISQSDISQLSGMIFKSAGPIEKIVSTFHFPCPSQRSANTLLLELGRGIAEYDLFDLDKTFSMQQSVSQEERK